MMRIVVIGPDMSLDDQTRAYTEYKVFSSLARYEHHIDHVEVVLSEHSAGQKGAETACTVTVTLAPRGRERVRACATRVYSAIDCAAARIEEVMQSRPDRPLSS